MCCGSQFWKHDFRWVLGDYILSKLRKMNQQGNLKPGMDQALAKQCHFILVISVTRKGDRSRRQKIHDLWERGRHMVGSMPRKYSRLELMIIWSRIFLSVCLTLACKFYCPFECPIPMSLHYYWGSELVSPPPLSPPYYSSSGSGGSLGWEGIVLLFWKMAILLG